MVKQEIAPVSSTCATLSSKQFNPAPLVKCWRIAAGIQSTGIIFALSLFHRGQIPFIYIYIYIYISACSVEDRGVFSLQDLLVKTFKFSCYFSYVWVKVVNKVPHTCPSTFHHFAGRPQGLCLIVAMSCSEFLNLFGEDFLIVYIWLIPFGGVLGLVIEYV